MEAYSTAVLTGAAVTTLLAARDVYDRQIPNRWVYPLILSGLGFLAWRLIETSDPMIAVDVLGGFLVIGGIWLTIFAMGGCGGGDVKLMAANGGLLGLYVGLYHMLYALLAGVAYLVIILFVTLAARLLPGIRILEQMRVRHLSSFKNESATADAQAVDGQSGRIAIPFAVAAALGYVPLLMGAPPDLLAGRI